MVDLIENVDDQAKLIKDCDDLSCDDRFIMEHTYMISDVVIHLRLELI